MLNSSHNKLWIFAIAVILSSCEDIQNHNSAPTISADNEMFKLSIQADTDVATITNTIPFEVKVKRRKDFVIRKDSKMIGTWALHSMEINSIEQNISQFPTAIEFYEDSAYSKIVTNTVSNVDSYFGGYWHLNLNNQLLLREQGMETIVQVEFDTKAIFVALDGFMVWNYEVDGNTIKEVYQKTIETDISIFHEDTSYLTVMSTGSGIIDGFTEIAKEDIAINIDYVRGSYYVFKAVFTPGLDLDSDAITASLDSEEYGHLTVQLPISIRLEDE